MSEEWRLQKELEAPLEWEPGCPLVIERLDSVRNETTGKLYLRASLRNVGSKDIEAAVITGKAQGEDGDCRIEFSVSPDVPCRPGNTFDAISKTIGTDEINSASLSIRTVILFDKTVWAPSGEPEPLPAQLELKLSDKAMAQRKRELIKLYNGSEEKTIASLRNKTVSDVSWWLCSCGAINSGREECWSCCAKKSKLISLQNEEDLEAMADDELSKSQEREREELERKERLRKNRPKIIGAAAGAVALVVICVLAATVFVPMGHVSAGDNARSQGNWDAAIAEYDAANGYGDSIFYSAYTKCLKAVSRQSGYMSALNGLIGLGCDLSAHVEEMIALGDACCDEGDYDGALASYQSVSDFADSNDAIVSAYRSASEALVEKGQYKYAVRVLEMVARNDDGEKLVYDTARECAQKALDQGNVDDAMSLYRTANKYGDSTDGINFCESIQKLQNAEKDFKDGKLAAAQSAFGSLPADLTFGGVNAGQRQALLSSHQEFVDMCGMYTGSNHAKVTQTSKRTGSSQWWDGDWDNAYANVTCKLTDDGTARISGEVSFYRCTNFSVISAGLKGNSDKQTFSFDTVEMPDSVDIGNGTTISISGGSFTVNYCVLEENKDMYFNYEYESSGTLSK